LPKLLPNGIPLFERGRPGDGDLSDYGFGRGVRVAEVFRASVEKEMERVVGRYLIWVAQVEGLV
jgi:hypothetical protein